MSLVPSYVSDGLQIEHVADGVVVEGDAACSENLTREPRSLEGGPCVLALGKGDVRVVQLAVVFQAGQLARPKEAARVVGQHVGELVLHKLPCAYWLAEGLPRL